MDNRFGFKDLVQALLLLAILVSVWVAMVMFDRQHETLAAMREQVNQQTAAQARLERSIGELHGVIERGVTVAGRTAAPPDDSADVLPESELGDPFERLREAQAMPDYAQGDWLIDAFGASVARITPMISTDTYGSAIQGQVLETLADRDPDTLEWRPLLARTWSIQDNREAWQAYIDQRQAVPLTEDEVRAEPLFPEDATPEEQQAYVDTRLKEGRRIKDIASEPDAPPAMTITFELRRGLSFSDGHELTAADVQYSYDLIMNPAIDAPRVRNYISDQIRSVKATGSHTVVYEFKEPYFEAFGLAAGTQVLPKHFYETFTPEEINTRPGLLLGSGKYRMESPTAWSPGQPLVLVRNERYWGEPAGFDRLVFREISNEVARLTAFRNGEIDVFSAEPTQYEQLSQDPEFLKRTLNFEYDRPNSGYFYVAWNQLRNGRATRFADPRVRRAMTMLIDRQAMVKDIVRGYGKVTSGPFNPLSEQYNHSIEPWPYDPERAKALLKEAGFEDRNGDGVIESSDGVPFEFELVFPSTGDRWQKIAFFLKDGLARAGVVVRPSPLEWSVFDEKLKSRDFDAIALGWSGGVETDIHQMFHSSNIGGGADNFISYRSDELDRLINEARQTLDDEERMAIWQQAHRVLHEDQPYTFLYTPNSLIFIDNRVRNVERTRLGLNAREEWFVPESLQKH